MRSKVGAGAVVAVGLLAGCATPYQRMGFAGGYRDTAVAPGVIRIEVRGNAFTSVETLEEYFHRRAKTICKPFQYDWRMDSGASSGPSTFVASHGRRSTIITEQPGPMKGWVTGIIACATTPPPAPAVAKKASARPPRSAPSPSSAPSPALGSTALAVPSASEVQVIDVVTGKVVNVPADSMRGQVEKSQRLALIIAGKVEAITPEGHRVQVDVGKVEAAKTLGYRLMSGAELAAEIKAAALGEE